LELHLSDLGNLDYSEAEEEAEVGTVAEEAAEGVADDFVGVLENVEARWVRRIVGVLQVVTIAEAADA